MRSIGFVAGVLLGFFGGSFVGYGLSEEELRRAMCSYYSEWDFCEEEKVKPSAIKGLAITGLSKELHELYLRVSSIERVIAETGNGSLCVKAYRLNVRLYPLDGKVIGIYRRGREVKVVDRIANWVRTEDGWVDGRFLKECSDEKVAYGRDVSSGSSGNSSERSLHGGDTSGAGKAQVPSSSDLFSSSSEVLR